jgi:streptogrisin C
VQLSVAMRGAVVACAVSIGGVGADVAQGSGARDAQPAGQAVNWYASTYGVSQAEAERRLRVQARGFDLGDAVKRRFGAREAGAWFDHGTGRFEIGVAPGASRAVASELIANRGLGGDADVVGVRFSMRELDAAREAVQFALLDMLHAGKIKTAIDPARNTAVVFVSSESTDGEIDRVERAAALRDGAVDVRRVPAREVTGVPDQSCMFPDCHRPLRAGVEIKPEPDNGSFCTVGFMAKGRTTTNRYAITAGHCMRAGRRWRAWDFGTEPKLFVIGLEAGVVYSALGDAARIQADGSHWDQPDWPGTYVSWGHFERKNIEQKPTFMAGTVACHVGKTTRVQCGTSQLTGVVVNYNNGDGTTTIVGNLTQWSGACSAGGDSGGPWAFDVRAYGIHSGSSGAACPSDPSDITYSYDVAHLENALSVTVKSPY